MDRLNSMKENDILQMMIRLAISNGFEFRRWFQANIQPEWPGSVEAFTIVNTQSRYYALIYSRDFAQAVWKHGQQMQFVVPSTTYSRRNSRGEMITVTRKPFTRRTIKPDVWKYHLQQMVLSDDPIRYLKRFLPTREDLQSGRTNSKASLTQE